MGDIFEDVMYRAFDKKGKAAGAFYTPRDAIKLMVDVLFAADAESLGGGRRCCVQFMKFSTRLGYKIVAQSCWLREWFKWEAIGSV